MKYKGLGCRQSYEEAVGHFKKSIKLGSVSSMYMLGLAYRNGYGITLNTDSARYWINRAAAKGYKFAKEELEEPTPENSQVSSTAKGKSDNSFKRKASEVKFKKSDYIVNKNKVAGLYAGYIIRYDWSGKHIIGQSKLEVQLHDQDSILIGQWLEDDNLSTSFYARLTDTALVFVNTEYERIDHYSAKKPAKFKFESSKLQLVKNKNEIQLVGTLQFYSVRQREPEKPVYISLTRVNSNQSNHLAASTNSGNVFLDVPKAELVNNIVKVYPNPFNDSFQAEFFLENSETVTLSLFSIDGRELHSQTKLFKAGMQKAEIKVDVTPGLYVFKVHSKNKSASSIVIKQ
jgi:hypothetical protein